MPMRLSLLEWVLLALCAVLAVVVTVQAFRVHHLAAARDKLAAEGLAWQSANASNVRAIAELRHANEEWAALAQQGKERSAAAVASLTAHASDLERQLSTTRSELEVLYARDPSARAWRDRPVPAGVADRLLEDAHR